MGYQIFICGSVRKDVLSMWVLELSKWIAATKEIMELLVKHTWGKLPHMQAHTEARSVSLLLIFYSPALRVSFKKDKGLSPRHDAYWVFNASLTLL